MYVHLNMKVTSLPTVVGVQVNHSNGAALSSATVEGLGIQNRF